MMARTPAHTAPTPADHQQMDRSNDPEVTKAMDALAPAAAMASRRQTLTGSKVGIGSIGFDESGAFDVTGEDPHDAPITSDPPRPKSTP